VQDKPQQPEVRPVQPAPQPEKSAAVGGASAIGRSEVKNAGYDVRSAPYKQKDAPGSEDPIQKSKPQELLQKGKDAAHNARETGPAKAMEAVEKKLAEIKENPVPQVAKLVKKGIETAAEMKFAKGDFQQVDQYAKIGGRGIVAQVETAFPKAAEKLHAAAGKLGERLQPVKEKAVEAVQDKLNPPPKDPQGPLFR
jgi:hypothetical protein